jgi:RNA polymerase sigma factor (sigma-70 family)
MPQLLTMKVTDLTAIGHGLHKMLLSQGHGREDAEDLAQEAFLKGLEVGEIRSPHAWLRKVSSRAGLTLLRRHRRCQNRLGRQTQLDPTQLPCDPWTDHEARNLQGAVRTALGRLPADLRRIVEMRMEGQSFRTVGSLLALDDWVVRRRFRKALALLRCLLGNCVEG